MKPEADKTPMLELKNLKMHFPIRKGFAQKAIGHVRAVDDVNFAIGHHETLGLVGESGCGKTTIGRCIVRAYKPSHGNILFQQPSGEQIDLVKLSDKQLIPYRRDIRMIFQDPYSSLNPRMTVKELVAEPMLIHRVAHGQELEDRVANLLRKVGLRPEYMRRYPHAFSGGQRQRLGIARALALDPKIIVCDEAVSALDVSVQAQILNLLQDLQSEMGLTYLFISHDLSVVEYLANRVAVMYVGKLVEIAPKSRIFSNPLHPYTDALLSAVPKTNPRLRSQRIILEGDVADPANPPEGCYFHPRCRYAKPECSLSFPALREIEPGHQVACHFAESIQLNGVKN
jgi:oligopeptide/dipeptide ABC transporter ATP-binding protein